MRRYFYLLLLFPLPLFADFTNTDSQNLSNTLQAVEAIRGNQVTLYELLQNFTTYSSSWGGHFIKTVGNAAAKFTQEFGVNGWFTAVKASIGVIQADVGRINTALTTVNDHLDIIEGDVSSIKDTAESINTSVESIDTAVTSISTDTSNIDSNLATYLGNFSEFTSLFTKPYIAPTSQYNTYTVVQTPSANNINNIIRNQPSFNRVIHSTTRYNDFFDALMHQLQEIISCGSYNNGIHANTLLKLHGVYITSLATTNLLQKILDTNDVWYAKIYDRISTNLTVAVSNIASNASNDWHYTAAITLSSSPVLQNLAPDISRDVSQSYMLTPPNLTGDFKNDVILLLAHAQHVAASGASVNMDILTNLQVVANSILSSAAVAEEKKRELQTTISNIEADYAAHQNDLDSTESSFRLVDNNNSVKSFLQDSHDVEAALAPLNVTETPDSYNITVPVPFSQFIGNSASFGDYFNIRIEVSQIRGVCRTIRAVFGVFWWTVGFGILFGLLGKGVRLLAWISNFINPGSGNQILTSSGGKI